MHPAVRRPTVTALLLFSLACGDEGADLAPSQQSGPSDRARLKLIVSTTGHTKDPSGYRVTLGDFEAVARSPGDTLVFDSLGPGVHSLQITGVARNCASPWTLPGTIKVPTGPSTRGIEVVCDSALSDVLVVSGKVAVLDEPLVVVRPTDGVLLGSLTGGTGIMDRRAVVSPDGRQVAFARITRDPVLWTVAAMQVMRLRVADGRVDPVSAPVPWVDGISWSPDGTSLMVMGDFPGGYGAYRLPAHGGSPVRVPLDGLGHDATFCPTGQILTMGFWGIEQLGPGGQLLARWSWPGLRSAQSPSCAPKGGAFLFDAQPGVADPLPPSVIFMQSLAGGEPVQLTPLGVQSQDPTWAPRENAIAYTRYDESDRWETVVRFLAGPRAGQSVVVHPDGYEPNWAPDLDAAGVGD